MGLYLLNKNNHESYYLQYLVENTEREKNQFIYLPKLDFTNLCDIIINNLDKDTQGNITIFGFPYKSTKEQQVMNEISKVQQGITDLSISSNIYHYCTFGDTLQSMNSNVSDTLSSIQMFVNNNTHYLDINNDINNEVAYLQSYHEYSFGDNEVALMFKDLIDFYGTSFSNVYSGDINSFLKDNMYLIKNLHTKRVEYISKKKQDAKITKLTKDICLVVVYAELYKNELAHALLNSTKANQYNSCIVLIGTHTKGSDMFSIRTRNISADSIARTLGNGRGKKNVASVFLPSMVDIINDTAVQYLTTKENIEFFIKDDKENL